MRGRPIHLWLELFLLSHRPGSEGWQRLDWPDGRPLLAQSWPLVLALHVIGDELDSVAADRRRRAATGRAG